MPPSSSPSSAHTYSAVLTIAQLSDKASSTMGRLAVYVITGASRGLGLELTNQAGPLDLTHISRPLYYHILQALM
jgi:hypothetical protein